MGDTGNHEQGHDSLAEQISTIAGPENEQKSIGLTDHLKGIALMCREISARETDEKKKDEYFQIIFQRLEKDTDQIKEMVEDLTKEELTENVAMLCKEVDEKFINASTCHLDAIELLKEYIDTEDSKLIERILELLKVGSALLEQADSLAWQLSQYSEESSTKKMEI